MRGRKEHLISSEAEKPASSLADARRSEPCFASFHIEHIDLVKRVVRLPFALKNQRLAVGRKITLSAPRSFKRDLTRIGYERVFRLCRHRRHPASQQGCALSTD